MTEEVEQEQEKAKRGRPRGSHFKSYKNLSQVKLHGIRGSIFPGQTGLLSPDEVEAFRDKIREA